MSRCRLLQLALVFSGALPMYGVTGDCRMFEVEVASVDASGNYHPLFNFGQALPLGKCWSYRIDGEAGTLTASITWEGSGSDRLPKVELSIKPRDPNDTAGKSVLEKLVWDSLFGPEPFTTSEGRPFSLPKLGRAFAAASVVPAKCGR